MDELEKDGLSYLASIFEDLDTNISFNQHIHDGILLCRIAHILKPEMPLKIDDRKGTFVCGANVQQFLNFCKEMSIPDNFMPVPLDVVNNVALAIKNVLSILFIICRISGLGIWPVSNDVSHIIDLDSFGDLSLMKSKFADFDPKAVK